MEKYCPSGHRVYRELDKSIQYPFFCPVCDENYYGVETTLHHADTDEVYTVESSNGILCLDKDGNVLRHETTDECSKVVWFDLNQYEEVWGKKPDRLIDILDIRGILADGRELVWRDYKAKRAGEEILPC